jgi:TPR repeat protein
MRRGDAARSAEDTWQLGLRSYTGVGATKDEREAVRLFRIAADAGHAAAQTMLGVAYRHAEGVDQDYEMAFRYHRLAAAQGVNEAQHNHAQAYDFGKGVASVVACPVETRPFSYCAGIK